MASFGTESVCAVDCVDVSITLCFVHDVSFTGGPLLTKCIDISLVKDEELIRYCDLSLICKVTCQI